MLEAQIQPCISRNSDPFDTWMLTASHLNPNSDLNFVDCSFPYSVKSSTIMPPAAPADVSVLSESEPELQSAVIGRGDGRGRGRGRGLGHKKAKVGIAETSNDGETQPLSAVSVPSAGAGNCLTGLVEMKGKAKTKGLAEAKAKAKAKVKASAKPQGEAKAKAKAKAKVQGATKAATKLAADVEVPDVAAEEETESLEPADSDGEDDAAKMKAKMKATGNAKAKANAKVKAKAKAKPKAKAKANAPSENGDAAVAASTSPVAGTGSAVAGIVEGANAYSIMRYISKNIAAVRRKNGEQILSIGGLNPKLHMESLHQICRDAIIELNQGKPLVDVKVMVASRKSALLAA